MPQEQTDLEVADSNGRPRAISSVEDSEVTKDDHLIEEAPIDSSE